MPRRDAFVDNLKDIRTQTDNLHTPVPLELVDRFTDEGVAPDLFLQELHARAGTQHAVTTSKQQHFGALEARIRERAGSLLAAPQAHAVATGKRARGAS